MLARPKTLLRSFGSKPAITSGTALANSAAHLAKQNEKGESVGFPELSTANIPKTEFKNYSVGVMNLLEFLQAGHRIEEVAEMEYKKYPYHISHNNPSSPDFVASEFVDNQKKAEVEDYNRIIDNLKLDLKLMDEYQRGIDHTLHHLEGTGEAGNTANVYKVVRDYGTFGGSPDNLHDKRRGIEFSLLDNVKITINNTPFHRKFSKTSNILAWEKELEDRPVNPHFHLAKGHKYDVETPYEERVPHVADRLGHPEVFPTPLETLLRLERFTCHPGHLDQPFVQTPGAEPDKNLNLRPGEVIYENPNIQEWTKFYQYNLLVGGAFFAVWYPFAYCVKSSTPYAAIREEALNAFYDQNFYNFDTYALTPLFYVSLLGIFGYLQLVG